MFHMVIGQNYATICALLVFLPVIYVPGSHGTVRLIGGLIPEEGTVEVCVYGMWSSVCPSYWNYKDVFVVCRQLGYPATGENDGVHCSFPCGSDI